MTKDQSTFLELFSRAKTKHFPKLEIVSKSDVWWTKLLPKSFNQNFWTTIFYTIMVSTGIELYTLTSWPVLLHELIHCYQLKTIQDKVKIKWLGKLIYAVLYGFPLSLGIKLLLTCWIPFVIGLNPYIGMAWIIAGLLCFIPQIPDHWRTKFELEGYAASMYASFLRTGKISDAFVEEIGMLFSDMSYYMMQPNKKAILKKLYEMRDAIEKGEHPIKDHPVVTLLQEIRKDLA